MKLKVLVPAMRPKALAPVMILTTALMGALTTVDNAGLGDKADHTASTKLMSVMRLKVPVLMMRSSACRQ